MNWIFLALLAPFIYAVNVFLDKYLISSRIPNYRSLPIFGVFLALPVVLILWIAGGFGFLGLGDTFWIVLSGIFTILAFSLYLEALIKEETSIVIILLQSVPIMVLILSYLILEETITQKQLLGFLLLSISSILASLKKEKTSFRFSKGLVYILLANLLWAFPYIFVKSVSQNISFANLVMYESIGVIIGGTILVIFIPVVRQAFFKTISKIKKPVLGLVLLNESLFLGAKIITYLAVTLGPVALVSVLGSTQIFFGVLLGIILTLIMPKVFKEDLSQSGLGKKVGLGVLALIGVVLVS